MIFIFYDGRAWADGKADRENVGSVSSATPDNPSPCITLNLHVENNKNLDKNRHSSASSRPAIVSFAVGITKKKTSFQPCRPEAGCVPPTAEGHGVAAKPGCDKL